MHRLADALAAGRNGGASWRDIASLTRQILLRARLLGNLMPLPVPLVDGLPTRAQWEIARCPGVLDGDRLRIHADDWAPENETSPEWEAAVDQVSWAVRGEWAPDTRPVPEQVEADPFWKHTLGFPEYRSLGQRQIARSVVLAPPGSTTIACLPTGHGKTPVALSAALLASRSEGVSVLVVPTVILAIDMERRVREILGKRDPSASTTRYAYVGTMSDEHKQEVRDAIAAGRQPMVITSPEAVTTGLRNALDDAARAGLLRYLIIDEAHLVEQWGNDFRSSFQTLAVYRQSWLSLAGPENAVRTLAMSATLTEQQVETLELLFGATGLTEVVWASELRQEPAYFLRRYSDDPSRRTAILEAVTLLPSPAILYTTEKKDADAWAEELRLNGLRRVAVVHGDSTEAQRRDALEGWSGKDSSGRPVSTRFDLVVGTSAFGLGVDLGDVRTVLHATVPETVDRYYQEVGRGGRDGNPCLAFLAFAPGDRPRAGRLNKQRILTEEVAWDRWNSMKVNEVRTSPSELPVWTHRIDLRTQRPHVSEDTDRNVEWNIKVLNLMRRARLIVVKPPAAPTRGEEEDRDTWVARQEAFYERSTDYVDVRFLDGANDEERFTAAIRDCRKRMKSAQERSLQRMIDILNAEACMAEVLTDYYTVDRPAGPLMTSPACRGCPACRRTGFPSAGPGALYCLPVASYPALVEWTRRDDPLARLHRNRPSLSLYWRSAEEYEDETVRLLCLLAARGTAFFGGAGLTSEQAEEIQWAAGAHPVIHDTDGSCARETAATVAWVLPPDADCMDETALLRYEGLDRLYLLHPISLRDPGRPNMLLHVMNSAAIPLDQARKEL
ncbi:protein DpdF [Kitasatospora cineracea]|uniref:protein DpdF n=1 Tax=Kitasatospora cineracea TaxID=88074 RepID=UPI003807144A